MNFEKHYAILNVAYVPQAAINKIDHDKCILDLSIFKLPAFF
jgi:hypothetical protein